MYNVSLSSGPLSINTAARIILAHGEPHFSGGGGGAGRGGREKRGREVGRVWRWERGWGEEGQGGGWERGWGKEGQGDGRGWHWERGGGEKRDREVGGLSM